MLKNSTPRRRPHQPRQDRHETFTFRDERHKTAKRRDRDHYPAVSNENVARAVPLFLGVLWFVGSTRAISAAAELPNLSLIIIIFIQQLTNPNHNKLPRRTEQTDTQARITRPIARANAATNGTKQSRQPQPGRDLVGIHQMAPLEHTSVKQAYYSFIDPGRMKG